jgi:hypothetical protein
MHVRTRQQQSEPARFNMYRIGAVVAQILSYGATYAFVAAVMKSATPLMIFLVSAGAELVLSLAKSAMFKARERDGAVGVTAFAFDALLNAGGLWPYTKNIGETPTAKMLAEWLGLQASVNDTAAVVIALGLGALLSVLPWYLWRAGDTDA